MIPSPPTLDLTAELGSAFQSLTHDPRITTKAPQFVEFVRQHQITSPEDAQQRFKQHLGQVRVFRGLCLVEGSQDYRRIFEEGILYSKLAAKTGQLVDSINKERQLGYWYGILARLHQRGTKYADSDFVFSVARFPEPQILPAAVQLDGTNKAYLLEFDMPAFDLLGITITDVARHKGPPPFLFRYSGILFNASDPAVEVFVLHKTHLANLSCQTFETKAAILNYCEPYRRRMETQHG